MGNVERKMLKRKVYQIYNDTQRALGKLLYLKEVFEGPHPEYVPLFDSMAVTLLMFQDMLGDLHRHAWGSYPRWDVVVDETLEEV